MSKTLGDLEGWSNLIKQSGEQTRKEEANWFTNNPPIKEFKIQREGDDYIQYGVWMNEEDFLVFYKLTPNSKYSFQHRMVIEKEIVSQLYPLIEVVYEKPLEAMHYLVGRP